MFISKYRADLQSFSEHLQCDVAILLKLFVTMLYGILKVYVQLAWDPLYVQLAWAPLHGQLAWDPLYVQLAWEPLYVQLALDPFALCMFSFLRTCFAFKAVGFHADDLRFEAWQHRQSGGVLFECVFHRAFMKSSYLFQGHIFKSPYPF